MKVKRMVALLGVTVVLASLLCACSREKQVDPNSSEYTIAVEISTPMDRAAQLEFPNAKRVYINGAMEGMMEVKTGKVDAYLGERNNVETALSGGFKGVAIAEENIGEPGQVAVGVSLKSHLPDATEYVSGFIREMKSTGVIDEMWQRWMVDKNYKMPDIPVPENPDKTVTVGTSCLIEPFSFCAGNEPTGFDVELARRFAVWANAKLEIKVYDWTGLYTVIATDQIDYAMSNFYIRDTDMMEYSESYLTMENVLVVADKSSVGTAGLIQNIQESFKRNFIDENRWETIADGLVATLKITVLSILLGTILGFFVCLGKRSKCKALAKTLDAITLTLKGIPILVLLMIFYYVVFVKFAALYVAVAAFSVNFAAIVSDMMKGSIDGIGQGQWEAADTLGFSRAKAFWRIIVPQALRTFLPLYVSAIVALLHLTSIAGYVTIIDITYAAQLIRIQTFDPFFPLIATAIVYLLLTWGISFAIGQAGKHFLYQRKPLHGIDTGLQKHYSLSEVAKQAKKDDAVIEVSHLKKAYENATPLKDVNCIVHPGEVISVIGPSGTGKSTLLRCMNHLEDATSGSNISFEVAYNADTLKCSAVIAYKGEMFNSLDDDDIGVKLVKAKTDSIEYEYENQVNIIRAEF